MNKKIAATLFLGVFGVAGFFYVKKDLTPAGDKKSDIAISEGSAANSTADASGDLAHAAAATTNPMVRVTAAALSGGGLAKDSTSEASLAREKERNLTGTLQHAPGANNPVNLSAAPAANIRFQGGVIALLDRDYGPFFDAIQLSGAARDRALVIMADAAQTVGDIVELSRKEGLSYQELLQLESENTADERVRLKEVIGAGNMPAYDKYVLMLNVRPEAEAVATLCTANGEPMSAATVTALARTLVDANAMARGSPQTLTAQQYKTLTANDPKAIAAAQKILTAGQLAIFQQVLAERFKHQ